MDILSAEHVLPGGETAAESGWDNGEIKTICSSSCTSNRTDYRPPPSPSPWTMNLVLSGCSPLPCSLHWAGAYELPGKGAPGSETLIKFNRWCLICVACYTLSLWGIPAWPTNNIGQRTTNTAPPPPPPREMPQKCIWRGRI